MATTMDGAKVLNGTYGRVWFNDMELANIKSFEAKVKYKYEDVDISEQMGKSRKVVGYEISGTMNLHKVDSLIAKAISDDLQKGIQPTLKIIARLADPSAVGQERVQLTGVTIDELTLLQFEMKKIGEEEVPFEAETYEYLEQI